MSRARLVADAKAYLASDRCPIASNPGDRRACLESLAAAPVMDPPAPAGPLDGCPSAQLAATYVDAFLAVTPFILEDGGLREHLTKWLDFDRRVMLAWMTLRTVGDITWELGTDPDNVCYRVGLLRDRGARLGIRPGETG